MKKQDPKASRPVDPFRARTSLPEKGTQVGDGEAGRRKISGEEPP
jgi:hypothetical protein